MGNFRTGRSDLRSVYIGHNFISDLRSVCPTNSTRVPNIPTSSLFWPRPFFWGTCSSDSRIADPENPPPTHSHRTPKTRLIAKTFDGLFVNGSNNNEFVNGSNNNEFVNWSNNNEFVNGSNNNKLVNWSNNNEFVNWSNNNAFVNWSNNNASYRAFWRVWQRTFDTAFDWRVGAYGLYRHCYRCYVVSLLPIL